jgi:DNA-binding transcriptional ArsR family regulator
MRTQSARPLEILDGRDDVPVFIHSELDDYGLSCVEFRVYGRLARRCGRGVGYESVPSMARDFEVSDRTVQRALRVLVECRLISEETRPGKTTRYTLNPPKLWQHKSQLKATRERLFPRHAKPGATRAAAAGGDTRAGVVVTPGRGVVVTPQPDEGSPFEGTPPKVLPHTHRAPAPAASTAAGVCVSKSKFAAEFLEAYAERNGLGDGWLVLAEKGLYDRRIERALQRQTPANSVGDTRLPHVGRRLKRLDAAGQEVNSLKQGGAGPAELRRHIEGRQDISEDVRAQLITKFCEVADSKPPADHDAQPPTAGNVLTMSSARGSAPGRPAPA